MKLGRYKGIRVKRPSVTVKEQDVLHVLNQKQKEHAVATSIEGRPAREGDQAILDFEAVCDGKPVPGGQSHGYSLLLGSHTFIPGFEEQIVGKSPGEEFDVAVTFPEHYRLSQLNGKHVTFHTTLQYLQKPEYQPLDDDFARDFSEYETLPAWKDAIRQQLMERRETSVYNRLSREIMSTIIAHSAIPIDDRLCEQLTEELYEDFIDGLKENRVTLETYCSRNNLSPQKIRDVKRQEAIRSIQEQSVLHAVAKLEHLTVTDDDLKAELDALAEEEGKDPDRFCSSLSKEDLEAIRDQLCMDKAMIFILQHAILLD